MKGVGKVFMLRRGRAFVKRAAPAILAAALGATLSFVPQAARATDTVELFGGGQGDYSNYVFVGATVALSKQGIGNGFAVRASGDVGGYNYDSSDLGVVRANFAGYNLDAVYQFTGKNYWNDVWAGEAFSNTTLTPEDPTNVLRGPQYEIQVGLDGGAVGGPYRTDWLGYYGTRLHDYAGRLSLTHALSPEWRLGVEGYVEGNPYYHLSQVGPYAGIQFNPKGELDLSTGWSWESGFNSRAYVRASFSQRL